MRMPDSFMWLRRHSIERVEIRGNLCSSAESQRPLRAGASRNVAGNLTPERLRATYGGVGSERYRQLVAEIEARLSRCAALALRID
jgi:hypothetical protein